MDETLSKLPWELVQHIFSFLDLASLASSCLVAKYDILSLLFVNLRTSGAGIVSEDGRSCGVAFSERFYSSGTGRVLLISSRPKRKPWIHSLTRLGILSEYPTHLISSD